MTPGRRAWVDVGLWVFVQTLITSVPGSAVPVDVHHPFDWLVHFGMYAVLGGLVARAVAVAGWPGRRVLWLLAGVSVAAALDEWHQLFIPGRNGSAADWVFDSLGCAAGLFVGGRLMASRVGSWLR